jgi:hypothetical protein
MKKRSMLIVAACIAVILMQHCVTGMGAAKKPSGSKTIIATFQNINAFEGSISLIFKDADGRERWFSNFEVKIGKYQFYMTTKIKGQAMPDFLVNPRKIGKKYEITFRTEKRINDNSGEEQDVDFVTAIKPLQ